MRSSEDGMTYCHSVSFETKFSEANVPLGSENVDTMRQNVLSAMRSGSDSGCVRGAVSAMIMAKPPRAATPSVVEPLRERGMSGSVTHYDTAGAAPGCQYYRYDRCRWRKAQRRKLPARRPEPSRARGNVGVAAGND